MAREEHFDFNRHFLIVFFKLKFEPRPCNHRHMLFWLTSQYGYLTIVPIHKVSVEKHHFWKQDSIVSFSHRSLVSLGTNGLRLNTSLRANFECRWSYRTDNFIMSTSSLTIHAAFLQQLHRDVNQRSVLMTNFRSHLIRFSQGSD